MDLGFSPSSRLPRWRGSKERACQCRTHQRCGFDPWVRKIPWRKKCQLTAVFLPGKCHGWRSLVGCSPWGLKESDTTEHAHTLYFSGSKTSKGHFSLLGSSFQVCWSVWTSDSRINVLSGAWDRKKGLCVYVLAGGRGWAGGDRCLLWQFILLFFSLLSRGGLKAHSSKHF